MQPLNYIQIVHLLNPILFGKSHCPEKAPVTIMAIAPALSSLLCNPIFLSYALWYCLHSFSICYRFGILPAFLFSGRAVVLLWCNLPVPFIVFSDQIHVACSVTRCFTKQCHFFPECSNSTALSSECSLIFFLSSHLPPKSSYSTYSAASSPKPKPIVANPSWAAAKCFVPTTSSSLTGSPPVSQ